MYSDEYYSSCYGGVCTKYNGYAKFNLNFNSTYNDKQRKSTNVISSVFQPEPERRDNRDLRTGGQL